MMKRFERIFLVVLDSVGIGEAPDADKFGDCGSHTLGNIANHVNGLNLPNLEKLGLANIEPIKGLESTKEPKSYYTKMKEASVGKDTMTGHWELMGLQIETPFQTYPNGFPKSLIDELERLSGRKVIGNKPASGTVIIEEYGEEHIRDGSIIVYTSQDSVLQIAAHEDIVPIEELYEICKKARSLTMDGENMVGRVIARPFIGELGSFERTANRHDYALKPFGKTVMDALKESHYDVISIGKIHDIFDGEGITKSIRTVDNRDGMEKLKEILDENFTGLAFLNLVDFDAKYGHRRDPLGYARALENFDEELNNIFPKLRENDLMIFTADHGNDPTFTRTDHTREFVPLLAHYKNIQRGKQLPIRKTFADVGATIADNFNVSLPKHGESFLNDLLV